MTFKEFVGLFKSALKDFRYFSIGKSYVDFILSNAQSQQLRPNFICRQFEAMITLFSHDLNDGSYFYEKYLTFMTEH